MVGRDTHLIEDCGMELNLTAQVREENNAVWVMYAPAGTRTTFLAYKSNLCRSTVILQI